MLKENKFKLHELAHYLYKKETITGDEFMSLLTRENPSCPRPHRISSPCECERDRRPRQHDLLRGRCAAAPPGALKGSYGRDYI